MGAGVWLDAQATTLNVAARRATIFLVTIETVFGGTAKILFRVPPRKTAVLLLVFVGALNPEEGLDVDHVARLEIVEVVSDELGKLEEIGVSVPVGPGMIPEVESVFARRGPRHHRLEKEMRLRLGEEAEHRD